MSDRRVSFLAQVLNNQWYDGKRTGDTPGGFRCYTPAEVKAMKTDWPRFAELAQFCLDVLDGKIQSDNPAGEANLSKISNGSSDPEIPEK